MEAGTTEVSKDRRECCPQIAPIDDNLPAPAVFWRSIAVEMLQSRNELTRIITINRFIWYPRMLSLRISLISKQMNYLILLVTYMAARRPAVVKIRPKPGAVVGFAVAGRLSPAFIVAR